MRGMSVEGGRHSDRSHRLRPLHCCRRPSSPRSTDTRRSRPQPSRTISRRLHVTSESIQQDQVGGDCPRMSLISQPDAASPLLLTVHPIVAGLHLTSQKASADRDALLAPNNGAAAGSASGVSSAFSSQAAGGASSRLSRTNSVSITHESPFASINMSNTGSSVNSPQLGGAGKDGSGRWQPNNPPGYDIRTNRALDEHDRMGGVNSALDGFLAQGQAVLGNLSNQRDLLKGEYWCPGVVVF